jgi:hypothetical protein
VEIQTITTQTLLTPICDAKQPESRDKEIINVGESQEYDGEPAFSENATSEIQEYAPTAHSVQILRHFSSAERDYAHLVTPL